MEHVLIARLDNHGDVLLCGPAVRAVRRSAGQVTLLCGPRGLGAARILPGVDRIMVLHAPWIDPEPEPVDREALLRLVDGLAGEGIDRAFVLTSFHQSPLPTALLLKMAGIPFVGAISDDYPGSLLDLRHRMQGEVHEVQRALSLVRAGGYRLDPQDDGRLQVLMDGAESPVPPGLRPYVVIHPGASVPARAWPADRHRALVAALTARGRNVVVTGGSDESSLTGRVAGGPNPRVLDLGGRTSLRELARVLEQADAVVVGNTGPAHLAAAVQAPVVSLFAPTVPAARWRPWKVPHTLLGMQDIACAGCRARQCPVPGHPCLSHVTVESVMDAVELLGTRVGVTAAVTGR